MKSPLFAVVCLGLAGGVAHADDRKALAKREVNAGLAAQNAGHYAWTQLGGWFFPHHYESKWLDAGPTAWSTIADFGASAMMPATGEATIDRASPEGTAFADWMAAVGATRAPGIVPLVNVRQSCIASDPAVTQRRMYLEASRNGGLTGTQLFTWAGASGGRVVFSDMHAGIGAMFKPYPTDCPAGPMSPQARAIAYGLFDVHTCIANAPLSAQGAR